MYARRKLQAYGKLKKAFRDAMSGKALVLSAAFN